METYDLTTMVMKQLRNTCLAGPNRETVIEYYLNTNFDRLLGNHVLDKENNEVFLKKDGKNQNTIEVKSIFYSEPIEIRIITDNQGATVSAKTETEVTLFDIMVGNDSIVNNIAFEEEDKSVKEHQEVAFEHGDANEFRIYRLEDGAIAYDGKIVPLLAAHGDAEYFDFTSFIPSQKKEESPSFLKRIYDSLNDQSLVKVVTSKELHNLTDYVDSIFDALRTKLETTREVKDIKKRKRTPEDKK